MNTCSVCNSQFTARRKDQTCCSTGCKRKKNTKVVADWKKANPEKTKQFNANYNNTPERKAYMKSYRQDEEVKKKERQAGVEYRKRNPEIAKNGHLMRKFGITIVDYDKMLEQQNGVCSICSQVDSKDLAVDHCHITGKVRGLLCFKCNSAIGKLNDSIETLQKAIDYLKK